MRKSLLSPRLVRANIKKTKNGYFFQTEQDFDFDEEQDVFIQYYPKEEKYIESNEYLNAERVVFHNWSDYLNYLDSISKK